MKKQDVDAALVAATEAKKLLQVDHMSIITGEKAREILIAPFISHEFGFIGFEALTAAQVNLPYSSVISVKL